MRTPITAAHVLGKLLKHVGEDNVVWGTDCIFYGSPQDQIQAFRAFHISEEFQDRYGYPALTKAVKRKVLGINAARLYGAEPITTKARFSRRELEEIRKAMPLKNRTYGPANRSEVRTFRAYHQGTPLLHPRFGSNQPRTSSIWSTFSASCASRSRWDVLESTHPVGASTPGWARG